MPRSKNYLTYPEAFHDLIREGATREVLIPVGSEREGLALRGRLYSFYSALERESRDKLCPPFIRDLRAMSTKVQLRVELRASDGPMAEEWFLIARPQDQDPAAQLISRALGSQAHREPLAEEKLQPSVEFLELMKKEGESND